MALTTSKSEVMNLVRQERWSDLLLALKTLPAKNSENVLRLKGLSFYKLGQMSDAIRMFSRLLKLRKTDPSVHINLGLCHFAQGDTKSARLFFENALDRDKKNINAIINLGLCLEKSESHEDVKAFYSDSLDLTNWSEELALNFSNYLVTNGDDQAAKRVYLQLLDRGCESERVYYALGNCCSRLNQVSEAIQNYDAAIEKNKFYFPALQSLGALYLQINRPKKAVDILKQAIRRGFSGADVCNNLGLAYQQLSNFGAAKKWLLKALEVEPNHRLAWSQLQNLRVTICDPSIYIDENIINGPIYGGVSPFTFLVLQDDPARQLLRSQDYVRVHHGGARRFRFENKYPCQTDRITLGFFSADFKAHATTFLLKSVLESLDRDQFKVMLFSFSHSKDDLTTLLSRISDQFFDVSRMPDSGVASLARASGVDIAIDLKGYTEFSRPKIFANGAAPIQVNYLGYPGSTGAPWIDYLIADRFIIPEEMEQYYSETVFYLPHCYQPTDNRRIVDSTPRARSDYGLPDDVIVLCSFNQNYKITPHEIKVWSEIMRQVPESILWLFKSNHWAQGNLCKAFEAEGIARSRIYFCSQISQGEHIARYRHVDVFLDSFNVNAHTTASDALWMGVPVITKPGKQFAARVAGSILTAMDLPDLIASSDDEYIVKAVELAADRQTLERIKKRVLEAKNTSPLFDTQKYAHDLGQLFHEMIGYASREDIYQSI